MPALEANLRANVANATARGLELIAYEGGQSLVTADRQNAALNALYDAANRHPRMGLVYDDYLALWRRAGGHLFVHYTDASPMSVFGRFGSLEYMDQPRDQAPKYDAVMRFIDANPLWW